MACGLLVAHHAWAVAERARRLGRLRVTHCDAPDFYLTAADREEERDENLVTASRMFGALARSESGARAVVSALAEVFPWVRHLSLAEQSGFAEELIAALSDAAELKFPMSARRYSDGPDAGRTKRHLVSASNQGLRCETVAAMCPQNLRPCVHRWSATCPPPMRLSDHCRCHGRTILVRWTRAVI